MSPTHRATGFSERVKEVFLGAAELPPPERGRYLDSACGNDAGFRAEVERLLAAFEESGGILDGPLAGMLAAARSARAAFAPNDRVGRFSVIRLLGTGGMGEVYEVSDAELPESLALKTLRQESAIRPEAAARFRREIQLARRITHRNVCRIFDVGRHDKDGEERWYFTMELLKGRTLAERLVEGPLAPATVIGIFRQAASGVAALHAAGIVHRDLKPGNVMLAESPDGERAVIMDFGVAHISAHNSPEDLTVSGQLIGTVKYMSPEQLRGEKVGPSVDVYALGIAMYESLRGSQTAAVGSWHERIGRDLHESRRKAGGDVECRLLDIMLRCVQSHPADRFANAGEILAWLERIDLGRRPLWRRVLRIGPARQGGAYSGKSQGLQRYRTPVALAVAASAAAASWPALRPAVFYRGCAILPGNSVLCELPAERDVAVFPFQVVSKTESEALLGAGYAEFLRASLSRLHPEPGTYCLHLRNDRSGDGVRLVLETQLRPHAQEVEIAFTVRDTWARDGGPEVLRKQELRVPLKSAQRLAAEPLHAFASALNWRVGTPEWRAWSTQIPRDAAAFVSYLRGLGLIERSRYTEAVAAISDTVDPEREFAYAPAHAALARAYRMLSNRDTGQAQAERAREAAERAVALDAEFDFSRAERELGELDAAAGNPEGAIRHFSAALKSWPFDESAKKSLAAAMEAEGRNNDAEKVYQQGIELAPRCWLSRNALADYYSRHSRYSEAERVLLEVIRRTPRNPTIYHNLAFDYIKRGRYDDAIVMASKSIALNASGLQYSTLGRAYLYRNCIDAALVNLRHAVSLEPDYYILWANLADGMARWNETDPAAALVFAKTVETSRRVLQQTPTHARARARLALNLARLGDARSALDEADKLLRLARNEESLLAVAQVQAMAGKRPVALRLLEEAFSAGLSIHQARVAPHLEGVRADAEYSVMLARRGIDPDAQAESVDRSAAHSCPVAPVPGQGF
jgi:tetratricopeptide (TPR) repeat protein